MVQLSIQPHNPPPIKHIQAQLRGLLKLTLGLKLLLYGGRAPFYRLMLSASMGVANH